MGLIGYNVNIFSNDGSTKLFDFTPGTQIGGDTTIKVTKTGLTNAIADYTYSGNLKFAGVATSANATEPTYAIGDVLTITSDMNLYIIESLEGTTWYVPSGWSATIRYGIFSLAFAIETIETSQDDGIDFWIGYHLWQEQGSEHGTENSISWANNGGGGGAITPTDSFTLSIKGSDDVTNPQLIAWLQTYGTLTMPDSPEEPETPIERGEIWYKGQLLTTITEGQRVTLHLEGFKAVEDIVVKNDGEVDNAKPLISFTIDGTTYYAEEGMTWADWCGSEYNTGGYYCGTRTGQIHIDGDNTVHTFGGVSVNGFEPVEKNHNYIIRHYTGSN